MLQVITIRRRGKGRGEKKERGKRRSDGLRELRTQPVTSCKAADRLCRTLISMYKYTHSTLTFGHVTALPTRVPVCLPACLLACFPDCLPACLPAYLLACLLDL